MASRPELLQMMQELELDSTNMTIEQMTLTIREKADKRFTKRKYKIPGEQLSETLRKFLTEEYDYVILDKDSNELNYRLERKDG